MVWHAKGYPLAQFKSMERGAFCRRGIRNDFFPFVISWFGHQHSNFHGTRTKKIDVKLVFFSVPFYSNRVQEPHSFKRGKQI